MNDTQEYPYATFLNVLYPSLSLVDVPSLVESCTDRWYNQTLCKVNDSVVRLGVLQGEYHWHKHDNDDEFFFVLDGRFIVDLEDRSVELHRQQGRAVSSQSSREHARQMARELFDHSDGNWPYLERVDSSATWSAPIITLKPPNGRPAPISTPS